MKKFTKTGTFSGKRIGAMLCATTFLLCGCSNENEPAGTDTDGNGRVPLQVSAGIQTRAFNNLWEPGDAIGIYMLNEATAEAANRKYITTVTGVAENGTFTAVEGDIYFPVDGSTRDFIAYYPHQAGMTDNKYAIDLSDQSSQKGIDLMRSDKVRGKHKDDATVAFVFRHKLVKVEVNIEAGNGMEGINLTGTTVSLTNQPAKGTFDVLTEGAHATADAATVQDITFCPVADGSKYEAIVFPAETTESMEMKFTVPELSATVPFTFAVSEAEMSRQFEAGMKYLYTITINKMSLGVTSTIESWSNGNGENGESGSAE